MVFSVKKNHKVRRMIVSQPKASHYANLPMQYTEIFFSAVKIENFIFLEKKLIFSYFCSKHRFWVHVRTALARQF